MKTHIEQLYKTIKQNKLKIFIFIICSIIFFVAIFLYNYQFNAYGDKFLDNSRFPVVTETNEYLIIPPTNSTYENTDRIIIFYPGAAVTSYSYLDLVTQVSGKTNIRAYIVKPLLNVALTDIVTNIEKKILERPENKDIKEVIFAGHSLGGVMACNKAKDYTLNYKITLVLLASYCNSSIADTNISTLVLSGSEDKLLPPVNLQEKKILYNKSLTEFFEFSGVSHAQFGNYGKQNGDGTPTIGNKSATSQIVEYIYTYLNH